MTAIEILRDTGLVLGEAKKVDVIRIYRESDDEHLVQQLIAAGCDWAGMSQWRRTNRSD